ncbi:uncharacterized protein LOC116425430 isoform X2 [Nomia melanderi]|uniref:uncharacterized protein LOC116425430 isoform X2 n=1 Tax=Nomia melanderi TaxID=2448451 RepID=UPI001304353B|nr:uncharacterized protein LOC116425430 isoform X2 [Nomia melanderi]
MILQLRSSSRNYDINTLYEGNETNMLTVNYNAKMKEIMNTLSSLHPDLKEYEKLPSDQCPLNVPKNKTIFNPNSLNVKDNVQEHIKLLVNNELQHNWKTFANEYKVLTEKTASIDPSNIKLRWKVIIKQYKSKTS